MTDPFSLSTGIAGLISLALQVYQQTITFVGDITDYPEEFSKLVKNTQEMYGLLCVSGPIIEARAPSGASCNPNHGDLCGRYCKA